MADVNDMFNDLDKQKNESSFYVPGADDKKEVKGFFTPLVEGDYLGHIVKIDSKIMDIKKTGNFRARLYKYEVEVADENVINTYTYTDINGEEQKAKGDVTEYIKFLSEESDENQTESDLNEAVEDISNFVDDQLGIVKPNQAGASRSGEKDIADGKKKFLDKQEKPKSKAKITTVENIEELIKERTNDREAALANERKKIKEEQGQIYTEERKNTKIEMSLSPNATPRVTKAELDVK